MVHEIKYNNLLILQNGNSQKSSLKGSVTDKAKVKLTNKSTMGTKETKTQTF